METTVWQQVFTYGRMIKFSHTVFALPFALSAVILAQRQYPLRLADIFWILVAMIAARSCAMGFNRIADARLDADNPRTRQRHLPSGRLSFRAAALFVFVSGSFFILAAAMLGRLCFYLALPALVILLTYSYTKRFTYFCHIYLGAAIALAPLGAWVAVSKSLSGPIVLLALALMTYIAGFDVVYACQDMEFDRRRGLHSIPVKFGLKRALQYASRLHVASFVCLSLTLIAFEMSFVYAIALAVIGLLLIIEHRLVDPDDLSRIKTAFFHVNSAVSVVLFLGVLADELYRWWM